MEVAKVKIYTSPAEEVGTLHASVRLLATAPLLVRMQRKRQRCLRVWGQGPVMSMNWDFCVQCPTTKSLIQGPELVAS